MAEVVDAHFPQPLRMERFLDQRQLVALPIGLLQAGADETSAFRFRRAHTGFSSA